jgi:hypothetical protein
VEDDDMAADDQDYMLTTTDNPWNPFTDWEEWYAWDHMAGYDTPSYLARVAKTSIDLSDADQDLLIRQAIDEIVDLNVLGIYIKIRAKDQVKISAAPEGGVQK